MQPRMPTHCPHSKICLGKKFICSECSHENEAVLFGAAVLDVARMAAQRVNIFSNTFQDDIGTAAAAMVQYKDKILTADNPTGMAITIATRAINKIYSKIKSVRDEAVGTWNFEKHEGNENVQLSERLEFLEGKLRPHDGTAIPDRIPSSSATARVMRVLAGDEEPAERTKIYEPDFVDAYKRMREFPGIHLLWNDQNRNLLFNAIQDFAEMYPDFFNVIDLRLAFIRNLQKTAENGENADNVKGFSWPEIAGKLNINERQARYKYTEGCRLMRSYLRCALQGSL
jgi:hypothetical protein